MDQLDLDHDINIYYHVSYRTNSYLGTAENDRYGQHIIEQITRLDEEAQTTSTIGQISAYKLLLGIAADNGQDGLSIFDMERATMDVGAVIYDFEKNTWHQSIFEFYQDELLDTDVLIGSRIEVLPAFRGRGIVRIAIKDLYNNFIQGCALFAIKCFPLQCEVHVNESAEPLTASMNYEQMEQDYKKAFRSLSAFYKSVGFQTVPGLSKDIMLINH